MKRVRQIFSPLIAGCWLAGCASTATQLPDIALPALKAESQLQETRTMAKKSEDLERLHSIGRRILLANAELCPKTRPDLGVLIHSADTYPKELRDAARREYGATDVPTVFKVAADSPAEKAGIQPGDSLIIDGRPVEASSKALRDYLSQGEVSLTVRSNGVDRTVRVTPDTLCRSRLRFKNSTDINAFANGRDITIMSGMMDFMESDDELAMIIGHELAHNTMGHIRKVIGNLILSGFATRYTRPFESEADYVGLYYMVRAGFDPENVEAFWRRLADVDPRSVNRAKTHPTFPDRYLRLAAAREEILSKRDAGEPLLPNFKEDEDE